MKKTALIFTALLAFSAFLAADEPNDPMSPEYRKIWNDDVQRAIDERIETYRKADATLELQNVRPNTPVKVEQIGHQFLFGAHIFNFDQLGTPQRNAKYKEMYGTLFNSATVAFYWKTFEPTQDKLRFDVTPEDTEEFWNACAEPKKQPHWRRPPSEPVIQFLESKKIWIHGHPLIWGNRMWQHPEWLTTDAAKVDEMEALFKERVRRLAERYGERVNSWDVVNESADDFPLKDKASRYGLMPDDYTYKAFVWANEFLPKSAQLNINDYSVNDVYSAQIRSLLERGCRIDRVGIQMHLFNPKETLAVAEGKQVQTPDVQFKRLSAADAGSGATKPLHLSEITITAPGDDERGRAIQAEVARNLYRYWFSWPTMSAITWWNTVDDCGAPGEPTTSGLFTRDMEPKPSFFALNKLINDEWKTRFEFTADGETVKKDFRGFKGTYRVSWTDKAGQPQSKEIVVK